MLGIDFAPEELLRLAPRTPGSTAIATVEPSLDQVEEHRTPPQRTTTIVFEELFQRLLRRRRLPPGQKARGAEVAREDLGRGNGQTLVDMRSSGFSPVESEENLSQPCMGMRGERRWQAARRLQRPFESGHGVLQSVEPVERQARMERVKTVSLRQRGTLE